MSIAAGAIAEAATEAVKITAESPLNAMSPETVPTAQLEANIAKAVEPVVEHLTNNEPWYQSRVTYGAITAIGGGAFGFWSAWQAGIRDWEILSPFIASVLGGLGTLYGRWVARKPIGA